MEKNLYCNNYNRVSIVSQVSLVVDLRKYNCLRNEINLGNTIQNSSNKQINGQLNFNSLYNKIPYLKKLNQQSRPQRNIRGVGRENNIVQDTIKKSFKIKDHFLRLLFSAKNLSVSYINNEGTLLPGYLPNPSLLGMDYSIMKPGLGFIFGSQNDITPEYHDPKDNPWISTNPNLNSLYTNSSTETINLRGTIEPFKGFRIELTGNRNFTQNMQEIFRYDTSSNFYNHYNPIENGSFSISYLCFKTSFFKNQDEYVSQSFEEFQSNRIIIAERLANLNPNTKSKLDPNTKFLNFFLPCLCRRPSPAPLPWRPFCLPKSNFAF